MVTRVSTVAFEGIEARAVDVQVQITPGNVAFTIVGGIDQLSRHAVLTTVLRPKSSKVTVGSRRLQQIE